MSVQIIRIDSDLPRVDYRLTLGEDPVFERITPENAYDLPYIRLVYRELPALSLSYGVYELWSVEVVDAQSDK